MPHVAVARPPEDLVEVVGERLVLERDGDALEAQRALRAGELSRISADRLRTVQDANRSQAAGSSALRTVSRNPSCKVTRGTTPRTSRIRLGSPTRSPSPLAGPCSIIGRVLNISPILSTSSVIVTISSPATLNRPEPLS